MTDLNPLTFDPSAQRPFKPKTELRIQSWTNGDADSTVFVSKTTFVAETVGVAVTGATGTLYLNDVVKPAVFWNRTSVTVNDPLYAPSGTPSILNAVSTSKPARPVAMSTVIVSVDVVPSPDIILLTFTSPLRGPMILNSSVLGWISKPADGKSGAIERPDAGP